MPQSATRSWRYDYSPFPKQRQAHETYADELLFGGSAGPGKTDWLLAEVITTLLELAQRLPESAPKPAAVIFRRSFPDLSRPGGIIGRLLTRIPRHVAVYNGGTHTWTFRNGAKLEVAHLEHDGDVLKYQGSEYQVMGWDQLEQFTFWQYRYLSQRLRASGELAARLKDLGYRPRQLGTANPGGPGHTWVKERWIDPAPPYVVWQPESTEDELKPGTRCFVPGTHLDNPALDETYRDRLRNLPPDDRRALEEGDWDVFSGQRFRHFRRATHVIEPEQLPIPIGGVQKAVGVDYGLEAPFVALWGARMADDLIVVYREIDGNGYTPLEQANLIIANEAPGERTPGREIPVALDPSTWARQAGVPRPKTERSPDIPPEGSIARDYWDAGLPIERAYNDRLAGAKRVDEVLRVRHAGHHEHEPCTRWCQPRILIYSTCTNLIRTLPGLVRSKTNPEDVNTASEDHHYDALRYLLGMFSRFTPPPPDPKPGPQKGPGRRSAEVPRDRHTTGDRSVFGGLKRRKF